MEVSVLGWLTFTWRRPGGIDSMSHEGIELTIGGPHCTKWIPDLTNEANKIKKKFHNLTM